MELLTPGFGLLFYLLLLLIISLVLLIASWVVILRDNKIPSKSGWLIVTMLFPIIGPLLFFVFRKRLQKA